jgi:hypothetical protein
MAAFGILNDLAVARTIDYGLYKTVFTEIGWSYLTSTANFLKHADRNPEAILTPPHPRENHWRIGFCLLLYRSIKGTLTPTMAAFHCWMVILHPDEFQLAHDDDKAFEGAYRHSIRALKESEQDVEMSLLNALIQTYQKGIIPPNIGFKRRAGGTAI